MTPIQLTKYRCDTCKHIYDHESEANLCDSIPIQKDKGIRVDDVVRILKGDGAGELAKVVKTTVVDRLYGQTQWRKYWHTVAVVAEFQSGSLVGFTRFLLFDQYEKV